MSKLINEPIVTHESGPDIVSAFIWRKRVYRVQEILSRWHEPGKWWDNEPVRHYYRVSAENTSSGVYELCNIDGKWFLHRVID